MPKIGWESSTLPAKLGSADSRPVGTLNRCWLPARTNGVNKSVKGTPGITMLTREQEANNLRSARIDSQRGNSGKNVLPKELPLPNLPCREEGQGSEASLESKGID